MKTTIRLIAATVLLLGAMSCQDKYYMPFKETDNGENKISFYLNGSPYRSNDGSWGGGGYEKTVKSWTSRNRFVLEAHCGPEHIDDYDEIRIEILIDEGQTIKKETDYNVTACEYGLTEEEEALRKETPHVWISFNGIYAVTGKVTFRKYTEGIISGNFECDLTDEEGQTHTIRYGNFDTAASAFASNSDRK